MWRSEIEISEFLMTRLIFRLAMAAPLIIGAASVSFSQDPTKRNDRPQAQPSATPHREENKKPADPTRYAYEFSQPKFLVRHIVIEHDALGRGKITFERQGEETPIVEPIELSIGALGRVLGLWDGLRFLDSNENYQASKQFPHLGTYRIRMDDGKRQRAAEFNWSDNKQAWALITEYRRVSESGNFCFRRQAGARNAAFEHAAVDEPARHSVDARRVVRPPATRALAH